MLCQDHSRRQIMAERATGNGEDVHEHQSVGDERGVPQRE